MVKEMERFAEKYSADLDEVSAGGGNAGNGESIPGERRQSR